MTAAAVREPADLNDEALRTRAVAAARGDAPFDVLDRRRHAGRHGDRRTARRRCRAGRAADRQRSCAGDARRRRRDHRRARRLPVARPDRHAHACREFDGDARRLCRGRPAARRHDRSSGTRTSSATSSASTGVRWAIEAARDAAAPRRRAGAVLRALRARTGAFRRRFRRPRPSQKCWRGRKSAASPRS